LTIAVKAGKIIMSRKDTKEAVSVCGHLQSSSPVRPVAFGLLVFPGQVVGDGAFVSVVIMADTAKIYALLDPRKSGLGAVRYIGKSINVEKRVRVHLRKAYRETTHKARWLRMEPMGGMVCRRI
jgi:hypothetical protein